MRDRELAGLAMVLAKDTKMKITISGESSYCATNGSVLNIARMPATPLGRMLMTGLVFHEVGHKNHTKGDRPSGIEGDMMNVIEDVRTEMLTIKDRPGTRFNLNEVTAHYIKKGDLEPSDLNHALIGKVMAVGRGKILKQTSILPLEDTCNEMIEDSFGAEFLKEVDDALIGMDTLPDTKAAKQMANKVVNLIKQYQQKQRQQAAQKAAQGAGGGGAGNQPGQGQGQGGANPNPNAGPDQGGGGGAPAGSAGGSGGNPLTDAEIDALLANNTGFGDISAMIQADIDKMSKGVTNAVKSSIPLCPSVAPLKPRMPLNEVQAISAASRMRARIIGLLESSKRKPNAFGLNGKKIAISKLHKIPMGDPKMFKKKSEVASVNTAIVVALDMSGSMQSVMHITNPAAYALHKTLYGLRDTSVCSLGFTSLGSHHPSVYMLVDFEQKPESKCFNQYANGGTPTDDLIWAARAKLLNRKETRKILLILTDGQPCNVRDTQAATKKSEEDGIEIAAIGIECESVKNIWANNRVIHDFNELPHAMFGVMEDLLLKKRAGNAR